MSAAAASIVTLGVVYMVIQVRGSRRDLEVARLEHLRDELRDAQADKTWPDSIGWGPRGGVRSMPIDLLADPGNWELAPGSDSMRFRFIRNALVMTNQGDEDARTGGIYYKPGRNWRDYVVELEFRLDAGAMTFCTRAEVMDTKHVPGISIGKEKCDLNNIEYGKTMNAVISVIGSRFNVALDGADVKSNEAISINFVRKGPVAIAIKPGTRLTITKFQVQNLR